MLTGNFIRWKLSFLILKNVKEDTNNEKCAYNTVDKIYFHRTYKELVVPLPATSASHENELLHWW